MVMDDFFVRRPKFHWKDIMHVVGYRTVKGKQFCKTALWSTDYHLWQRRNGVIPQGRSRTKCEETIIKAIQWEVKIRVESMKCLCNSV